MTQILHSSKSDEWFTPNCIVDLAREVLGTIDLDPASCEAANEIVKATKYFDIENCGLINQWSNIPINVFINPPSGKHHRKSLMKLFWEKLLAERENGLINQAIFVGFSLEQLQTTQNCSQSFGEFPICLPKSRVKFVSPSGLFNSPTHGQVIVYVPGISDETNLFYEVFGQIGVCMSPIYYG
jgi:ParB family chromosome partitioning protein